MGKCTEELVKQQDKYQLLQDTIRDLIDTEPDHAMQVRLLQVQIELRRIENHLSKEGEA